MKCETNEIEETRNRQEKKRELLKAMELLDTRLKKGEISLETYRCTKKSLSDDIALLIIEQAYENRERGKKNN